MKKVEKLVNVDIKKLNNEKYKTMRSMKPLVGGLPNMCYHFQLSNLFKRLKTRFRKP